MANPFRRRLAETESPLVGLLCALVDPVAAEIVAGAGYDWLLLDGEHATNTPRSVLAQLQAMAAHDVAPVVRPVSHDPALVKQYLDIGVQTLLVPMVDSAEQATTVVASTRYAPRGIRGVGAALGRVTQWGRDTDYLQRADEDVFVVAQVESTDGLANVEEICAVDGIDATLVGPADLAASLGHLGDPEHPEVRAAVLDVIERTTAAGLPAGVFAPDPAVAASCVDAGARFLLVGTDVTALARATDGIRRTFDRSP